MAFGIDDALGAAAAGISLTDTCVKVIQSYRKQGKNLDIEILIEEVRITALRRIDQADVALMQLERTLVEGGTPMDVPLVEAIARTPFYHPFQAHRLRNIWKTFNDLADATYSATDDIAALVRCCNQTEAMGQAVVHSAKDKNELRARLLASKSIHQSIAILREELSRHKHALK